MPHRYTALSIQPYTNSTLDQDAAWPNASLPPFSSLGRDYAGGPPSSLWHFPLRLVNEMLPVNVCLRMSFVRLPLSSVAASLYKCPETAVQNRHPTWPVGTNGHVSNVAPPPRHILQARLQLPPPR